MQCSWIIIIIESKFRDNVFDIESITVTTNQGQGCQGYCSTGVREAQDSGRTFAYHAPRRGQPGFDPGSRRELLGVQTWLSTLEIVNLSVFRKRQ